MAMMTFRPQTWPPTHSITALAHPHVLITTMRPTTAAPLRRGLHVAVVGSGPAGFFTASRLVKNKNVRVDMFEKLPTPFGLVRYGVAPDHTSIKNMEHKFQLAAEKQDTIRLVCNVAVGKDIPLSLLKTAYDAVVLCFGSQGERRLGIPGETATHNVMSSREFVGWYNGHPDAADLDLDLGCTDTAVVVGQGNVAFDVARTLLMPVDELAKTDMPTYAVEALAKSRIRRVHVVGRRGPVHAAFTSKELRTMSNVANTALRLDATWLQSHLDSYKDVLAKDPARKRLMNLMLSVARRDGTVPHIPTTSSPPITTKEWVLDFLLSPRKILTQQTATDNNTTALSSVCGVEFETNTLIGEGMSQTAVGTGTLRQIPAGLVVTCVGYLNQPLAGEHLPWDDRRGLIPNEHGRVTSESGLYVAGWVKSGPRGDIAATMHMAHETADLILHECNSKTPNSDPFITVDRHLKSRCVKPVMFSDWQTIDHVERKRGADRGKPREKITTYAEMLDLIRSTDTQHHHHQPILHAKSTSK